MCGDRQAKKSSPSKEFTLDLLVVDFQWFAQAQVG